jgi:hypothetical protein
MTTVRRLPNLYQPQTDGYIIHKLPNRMIDTFIAYRIYPGGKISEIFYNFEAAKAWLDQRDKEVLAPEFDKNIQLRSRFY